MASLLFIIALLVFPYSFPSCLADSSRKELRVKDTGQKNDVHLGHSVHLNTVDPSCVVQLSRQPRVFLYKNLLSDGECDHLIALAKRKRETSSDHHDDLVTAVADRILGSKIYLDVEDNIVSAIEERISIWSFLPEENGKPLHVVHHGLEKAGENYHYFGNEFMSESNKPLMATIVLYLSNVTRGGEIVFPDSQPRSESWSNCARSGKISRPTKGNAILFFSLHPSASPDMSSSHARCPVLEGEMWVAIKLLYARPIGVRKAVPMLDSDECTDEDDNCSGWASKGECQRNPIFMVGSPDYYGTCRKSCNAC